jgi:hypothetical protein
MKLKCNDCGAIIDTTKQTTKVELIKIGNCWHCIKCREYKFIIKEID